MNCLQSWPEPIVRVQSLSDSGITTIPERFVRPRSDRPSAPRFPEHKIHIPVINLQSLDPANPSLRKTTLGLIHAACRDWGFFQVVNHGVSHRIMAQARQMWRQFFHLPLDEKQKYANTPITYEGYGSRLGIESGAKLDWSDYFFLHYLPVTLRDQNKWPTLPEQCRETVAEYNEEVTELCGKLMKVLSASLGLGEDALPQAFGGDGVGACLRVNFYPKCPQPDLTLGLSPHSDPGGITLLLPDPQVSGLQVRKGDNWVTVKPVPNAFIVNLGDQIEVLTNGKYRSVEHRVIVNSGAERVSMAFFYNPRGDILIEPMKGLVTEEEPSLYTAMKFNEYRVFIRTKGISGKALKPLQKLAAVA